MKSGWKLLIPSSLFIVILILLLSNIFAIRSQIDLDQDDFIPASSLLSFGGVRDSSFGEIVSGIGDYNQDGFEDIVVGGRQWNGWQGKTWIYYGSENGPVQADFTIMGEPNRDGSGICMGHSVFNVGDVNGDGVDDFAASGPGGWGGWDIGKVYLFYGNPGDVPTKAEDADFEFSSPSKYDWFGEVSRLAGDFNGDGYPDIIIGAPGTNWPENQESLFESGRSYIYLGSENGYTNIPDITLHDDLNFSAFGLVVDGDGDINNDGLSDVIVSASWSNSFTGKAHVYLGTEELNPEPTADLILTGNEGDDQFAKWVGIINDLNGDGYDEIALRNSFPVEGSSHKDEVVYLYFGRADLSTISEPDLIFRTEEEQDDFGFVFNPVGDLNGDSFTDFAIGAPGTTLHPGKVYVYFGGSNLNTVPDMQFIGEDNFDRFGYYVNAADVNGDGTPDLLMTSLFNDDVGRVYIDLSEGVASTPDLTTESSTSDSLSILYDTVLFVLVMVTNFKLKSRKKS